MGEATAGDLNPALSKRQQMHDKEKVKGKHQTYILAAGGENKFRVWDGSGGNGVH